MVFGDHLKASIHRFQMTDGVVVFLVHSEPTFVYCCAIDQIKKTEKPKTLLPCVHVSCADHASAIATWFARGCTFGGFVGFYMHFDGASF